MTEKAKLIGHRRALAANPRFELNNPGSGFDIELIMLPKAPK
jgi:hypothetical protein